MAVKEVVKTEYHTDDGSVFEDRLSADKHDLAVSARMAAAVEAQAAILASFRTADLDAAFESAVVGGPVLPTEDAIRRLAALLFLFARRPAAVDPAPKAPASAVTGAAVDPAPKAPASAVTGAAVGTLADNLAKLNAAPAPEPEVAPEAPKPDIFAHNR